jgi:hypothetical protein
MTNLRMALRQGPATQQALAQEHRFARSRWSRVPATVGVVVAGSLGLVAGELGGLWLQVGAVGASALVVWSAQPRLERACRVARRRWGH